MSRSAVLRRKIRLDNQILGGVALFTARHLDVLVHGLFPLQRYAESMASS